MKTGTITLLFLLLLCCCYKPLFAQYKKEIIDSLHAVLRNEREDTNKVWTLDILSATLFRAFRYAEARKYANDALLLSEKIGFIRGTSNALVDIGLSYYGQSNYDEALKNYFAALKIREEIGNKERIGNVHLFIGEVYWSQSNYPEALKNDFAALKIREEIGDINGIADAYNNIGNVYEKQGNYSEALKNYFAAFKIKNDIMRETYGMAGGYINIGNIYEKQGNYPEALKNYFASLKISEAIGAQMPELIAKTYRGIGNIYYDQGNFPEALKNYFAALKMSEEAGDKVGIAICYQKIGVVYSDQGNFPEALKNYFASLKMRGEIGNKEGIASSYNDIGHVYEHQANYPEAVKNYLAGLTISEEIGAKEQIATSYIGIGATNIKLKKFSEAKQFLKDGLSLSKEMGSKEFIKTSYSKLAELDSATGDWESAYKNDKLFTLYRDSLVNDENSKKIVQTQMQYEFDKKEDSLKQKQLLTEINLHAQAKQKDFYLIGAILFALLSVFVFLNFRNQRKLNQLSNVAHSKEKAELELHSLRAQLNPHFMFNSLNAIQELILKEDFDNSHTYLARFAKLLRMLLENAEKPFVSLNSEIDFLELYLSLEKLRVPDLSFSITVDRSINTGQTLLPNMVLQPYIENALWHGLSHKNGDKNLELIVEKQNEAIVYNVKDNGVGRKKAAEFKSLYRKEHKSKGMELLTKRFRLLNEEFGSEIKTQVSDVMNDGEAGGTLVSINVPGSISENLKTRIQ